jgi:hypothetical protein
VRAERFDGMQIGDIAFDDGTFLGTPLGTLHRIRPAPGLDGGGGLFERFARASAEDGVRAEFGQRQSYGSANAASGAGDDRDLARQWRVRR